MNRMVEAGLLLSLVLEGCAQPSVKQPTMPSLTPNNPIATEVTPLSVSKTSELIGPVAYAIPAEDVPQTVEWKGDVTSAPMDITWQDVTVQLKLNAQNGVDVQFTVGTQVAMMPVWHEGTDPAGTWVLSDGVNGHRYAFTDQIAAKIGFSCGDIYIYLRLTPNGWQVGAPPAIGGCDAVPTVK